MNMVWYVDLLFDMNRGTMNKRCFRSRLCGCGLVSGCGLICYVHLLFNINNGAMNKQSK